MEATGQLTLHWFEPEDGLGEIIFNWAGGPVIELTVEAVVRWKEHLYRHHEDGELVEGLFNLPNGFNERGKIGPYKVMCIGHPSISMWEIFVARTDTIAGRLAITRARIEETGRAIKLGIMRILRAWNLAVYEQGAVIGWDQIKAVRWVQERIGHG